MALLIVLAIVGGLAVLSGLYLVGVEICAILTAWTITFRDRVVDIRDKRKSKKAKKSTDLEEEIKTTNNVESDAVANTTNTDIDIQNNIINESMIEEVR